MQPGPEGSHPLSFTQLVQPLLDKHCVTCHDGSTGEEKSDVNLSRGAAGEFSVSYQSLRPFVRWYEWGGESIRPTVTIPGHMGADASPLTELLETTHRQRLALPDADRRRLYLWLDANAPFYGTYESIRQEAQRRGEQVAMPQLQ